MAGNLPDNEVELYKQVTQVLITRPYTDKITTADATAIHTCYYPATLFTLVCLAAVGLF